MKAEAVILTAAAASALKLNEGDRVVIVSDIPKQDDDAGKVKVELSAPSVRRLRGGSRQVASITVVLTGEGDDVAPEPPKTTTGGMVVKVPWTKPTPAEAPSKDAE